MDFISKYLMIENVGYFLYVGVVFGIVLFGCFVYWI